MATYTLGEIASRLGGKVQGDASRRVAGLKPLKDAGPDDLSFLSHPRYRRAAASSPAGALLAGDAEGLPGHNLILVANPYAALARAIGLFYPEERAEAGISPQAVVAAGVRLGRDVAIGPGAVVGRGTLLGDRVTLMPGVIVGEESQIGDDSILHPGVVLYRRSILGARVIIHACAVVGSDGFGYAEEGGRRAKIPQVGNVVIEDDVEIGACSTIDRGTFGSTVLGRGSKVDNLVQIAHNVVVGEDSVLVAQSGVAGSTTIGRRTILAGQSGIGGHLTIGDGAVIGAKSAVLQDLDAGRFVVGHPAQDHRAWKRAQAALRRLPELLQRVARLEKALSGAAARGIKLGAVPGGGARPAAKAGRRPRPSKGLGTARRPRGG